MRPKKLFRYFSGLIVLGLFLFLFLGKLFSLQLIEGADYLAKATASPSSTTIATAARGEIWDSEGNTWVSNGLSWDATLESSAFSLDAEKLLLLYEFSLSQNRTILDSLPIESSYPYSLTEESSLFTRYLGEVDIADSDDGEALLTKLSALYALPKDLSNKERRALVGILYELDLRRKGLSWTDYHPFESLDLLAISTLQELGIDYLSFSPKSQRAYASSAGAHILGTVGAISSEALETYQSLGYAMDETVGKDGAELAFESYLHGNSGILVESEETSSYEPLPQSGNHIELTISLSLQEKVEEILASEVSQLADAKGAAVVMMDVNSGDILSLASYPSYDLSTFYEDYSCLLNDELNPLFNRAIQGRYAPGSTFKMVTAVAALEEGIISPDTEILDTGIYTYYSTPQPSCWIFRELGETHGIETVTSAITDSCNVFFYDIGRRLGIDLLENYAHAFGLGKGTSSPLLGEVTGTVAGQNYTESLGQVWQEGSTLSAAIGQENNSFTPLELCNYIATLANGGTRYKAELLKAVYPSDGGAPLFTSTPTVLDTLTISQETWDAVTLGMLNLCTEGSLSGIFADLDFSVAAKTGSVQVSGKETANAVFVAFAPYENPEVALAIVVEEGGSGGNLAPMAAEMLKSYFGTSF